VITILVPTIFIALAIFGVVRFPSAPITKKSSGYFDKLGRPKATADYEAYLIWHSALKIAGTALAVTALSSAISYYQLHGTFRIAKSKRRPGD